MPVVITQGALSARALGFNGGRLRSTLTWNPADKGAVITLSNGNLTATQASGTTSFPSVRGTVSRTAGRFQFNVTCDVAATNMAVGLANSTANLTTILGVNTTSIGFFPNGTVVYNGSTLFNAGSYTNGDRLGVAVDIDNKLAYFNKNNGAWSAGANIAAMGATLYPIAQLSDPTTQFSLVFTGNAIRYRQW